MLPDSTVSIRNNPNRGPMLTTASSSADATTRARANALTTFTRPAEIRLVIRPGDALSHGDVVTP